MKTGGFDVRVAKRPQTRHDAAAHRRRVSVCQGQCPGPGPTARPSPHRRVTSAGPGRSFRSRGLVQATLLVLMNMKYKCYGLTCMTGVPCSWCGAKTLQLDQSYRVYKYLYSVARFRGRSGLSIPSIAPRLYRKKKAQNIWVRPGRFPGLADASGEDSPTAHSLPPKTPGIRSSGDETLHRGNATKTKRKKKKIK